MRGCARARIPSCPQTTHEKLADGRLHGKLASLNHTGFAGNGHGTHGSEYHFGRGTPRWFRCSERRARGLYVDECR
ncbi:MAG: hypothetical protein H6Q33_3224 [Deltaproteobacteria bacterium]|nr:hypothetical protein [Deltaproteobacteria bacterium]